MADSSTLLPLNLPDAAQPAWRAYCAMLASKDAHFGFLEQLNRKVNEGGQRTLAEAARLQQLLAEHNTCVKDFASTVKGLASSDPIAHAALVAAIANLNQAMGATVN